MKKALYAPEAEQDIYEAAGRIAEEAGSLEPAHRFIDGIDDTAQFLVAYPKIGRLRPEISPRLRSFPAGPFVIFYRPTKGGVEIARVIHGARDVGALF